VSEDEKREGGANEGGQGSEAPKVPAPPKLTLDPEEKAAEGGAAPAKTPAPTPATATTPTATTPAPATTRATATSPAPATATTPAPATATTPTAAATPTTATPTTATTPAPATAKAATATPPTSTASDTDRESRRKRRKPASESTPSEKPEKVEAALVVADLPARSRVVSASEPEPPKADAGPDRMDLPKWNRARVKRKQVAGEEEDAFQAGVRKAGQSAIRRAPLVIVLILLVSAGIAGVVWWRGHQAEKDAEATRLLASAAAVQARAEVKPEGWVNDRKLPFPIPLLDEEAERAQQVEKALGELQATAEGSEADRTADLMRAAQQYKDGKFTDALASYTQFLEGNPKHELAFLAHEGKAMALEATGDIDGALAALDTLAGQKGDFYRDQALYQKARILEAADRKDDAIAVYEQYVEEYPLDQDSLAKPQVIERLRELKPELVPAEADAPGAGGFGLPPGLLQ
jgi:predicted negative regulator of RcsB-dependent stress response